MLCENLDLIIILQSHIKGMQTRKRIKDEIRQKLLNESTISDHDRHLCKNTHLLRLGSFLLIEKLRLIEDEEYVLQYSQVLQRSMKNSAISQSFGSLFLSTKFMNTACKVIKQLVRAMFGIISKADVTKIYDARKITNAASMLHNFCTCTEDVWPILKGKNDFQKIMDKLCTNMLKSEASKENVQHLIRIISDGVKGPRQSLNERTIDQVVFVTIRFLQIAELDAEETCRMFLELLKVPSVTLLLTEKTLHFIDDNFENLIKWLSFQENTPPLTTSESLNIVANFICLAAKNKKNLSNFLLDWAFLVNHMLENCSKKPSNKSKSNCWHHPLLGWTSERIEDNSQTMFLRLQKQISLLWSQEMVQFLSNNFFLTTNSNEKSTSENEREPLKSKQLLKTPNVSINSSENMPTEILQKFIGKFTNKPFTNSKKGNERLGSDQAVPLPPITLPIILCQLYQNALFAFHNSRIDILSNLSRDDSLILIKLWNYVDMSNGSGLRAHIGYLVTDPEVNAPQFAPLHLFGDTAYSLISILDEKEMYESEKPFTLQQLRKIAYFANRFCFYAIWDSLIDFEQDRPKILFNSLYQLLCVLHNRDCRRPFTNEQNFWTIPELSSKAFIAEFERSKSSQRAQLLMEKMPHIIPLRDRIFLFRKFISEDKEVSNLPTNVITVERSRLIEDGYRQLGGLTGQALRGTIRVKFINQQGLDEAGIDQDGVFKEFLELTLKQVFTPELNLFKCTHDKLLFPTSTSSIQENHLELFNFVGRMLGKAVYEGICVDVQLAPVLLAAVLGKQLCPFDELASLDPLLYKNLTFVKHYTASEDVEDLALTFSFQEEFLGKIHTHELVPGGRDLKVNNENKISYLHLMAHYRVVKQIREQTRSFVSGFRSLIKEKWLALFSTHELQFLISGQLSDIDLEDLRKHVQYYGGFHNNHRLIRWLWSILDEDFSAEERRLFLKFVTSCSRPPLLGFAYLEPCFSIRCIETSDDLDQGDTLGSVIRGFLAINKKKHPVNERLPTASTCFNLLKLPNYTKRSILLDKLRYAIHAETGFELS